MHVHERRTWRIALSAAVIALVAAVLTASGAASAAGTVTYTNTETIPVPPASSYSSSGGGDGWGLAFSDTEVFNVFHHQGSLQVACHEQSDGSECYNPVTVQDSSGNNFGTSGHPGMYFDKASSHLYVYATRDDSTAGVVCFDTAHATATPFCGFTALTAGGNGYYPGMSNLSDQVTVGDRIYAYNYFPDVGVTGDQNVMLCFDISTGAACAGAPYALPFTSTTFSPYYFPEPQVALIGHDIVVDNVGDAGDELSCFDTTTHGTCSGSWPIAAPSGYSSGSGAPFPKVSSTGTLQGFCLPTGADPCYDLTGGSITTPAGMPAAIPGSDGWNGQAVVLGPRVYVANGNFDNQVFCYNASTDAECGGFPKSFDNLSYIYTTYLDPQRPSCIWVNADGGSQQIQNFDAYSGSGCGEGPIRVLASSFVVNAPECTPGGYTSLTVDAPDRSTYTDGSVSFLDGDGNPIPSASDRPIDATGKVDLTGLDLNTSSGLPQFLITLNGASGSPGAVTVTLSWTGTYDRTCASNGTTVDLQRPVVTGVSPSSGTTAGGQTITVTGEHFAKADRVVIGTTRITSITVVSDTEIQVTTPAHVRGTVQVRVHNAIGLSMKKPAARFRYLTPAVSTATGAAASS